MLIALTMDIVGLSRIDPSTLTDQQMIELFFSPDDFEASRVAFRGDEDDACSWNSVKCDEFGYIVEFHWLNITLDGSINFKMIPRHLIWLNIGFQSLIGEVETTNLPQNMIFFCIQKCFFTGTVDLGALPRSLTDFYAMENKISGLVNVCNLPSTLRDLQIIENIEGTVNVQKLPETLSQVTFDIGSAVVLNFEDESDRDRVTQ